MSVTFRFYTNKQTFRFEVFEPKIAGGFTQLQSDWNEVDSNSVKFIKNKPSLLELGETQTTAGRGDYTKTAYDHSQTAHAPSNAQKNSDITKEEIEAKLTGEITSHSHASSGVTVEQATDIAIIQALIFG